MTDPWDAEADPRPWLTDGAAPVPHQYVNRAYWTSEHTWCDPDCFECGGEGAPCCEPPDHPYGAMITYPRPIRPRYDRSRHIRTIYPLGDRL